MGRRRVPALADTETRERSSASDRPRALPLHCIRCAFAATRPCPSIALDRGGEFRRVGKASIASRLRPTPRKFAAPLCTHSAASGPTTRTTRRPASSAVPTHPNTARAPLRPHPTPAQPRHASGPLLWPRPPRRSGPRALPDRPRRPCESLLHPRPGASRSRQGLLLGPTRRASARAKRSRAHKGSSQAPARQERPEAAGGPRPGHYPQRPRATDTS